MSESAVANGAVAQARRPAHQDARTPDPPAKADPCVMVIFGASGDLTRRKLLPAIVNLRRDGLLDDRLAIIGVARLDLTEAEFRRKLLEDTKEFIDEAQLPDLEWAVQRFYYVRGDFNDDQTYAQLTRVLQTAAGVAGRTDNVLYYLATPPDFFGEIVARLGQARLTTEGPDRWRRVIVEKPFGEDLSSAVALNRELGHVLRESQIYRIDHYLGKETVQNLMVFRFANGIFEPIWNRRYVDHVQITVAETVGVEGRGGYYESAGALRDMIQNHLFQILALTAMEPPPSFEADRVRDERLKALLSVRSYDERRIREEVVRGQYTAGTSSDKPVPGYREEPKVDPHSETETYVAMRVFLDNWRWANVPFYLRTGKRLPKRVSEVAIQFKSAPLMLFRESCSDPLLPNNLIVRIQPDEGISLRFQAKVPGPDVRLGQVRMEFKYADYFGTKPSTGYETLLYDCMTGDPTLFHRADIIEAGWRIVTPILDAWKAGKGSPLATYAAGSWGPSEASELLQGDGRDWRQPSPEPAIR